MWPYVVTLHNWTLTFAWYMARIVVQNRQQNRHHWTMYSPYNLLRFYILGSIENTFSWEAPPILCDRLKRKRIIFTFTSHRFCILTPNLMKFEMTICVICNQSTAIEPLVSFSIDPACKLFPTPKTGCS